MRYYCSINVCTPSHEAVTLDYSYPTEGYYRQYYVAIKSWSESFDTTLAVFTRSNVSTKRQDQSQGLNAVS